MPTALTILLNEKLQEKFDGNASELARAIGTSQQNISNWLSGDVIKPAYWKRAARELGVLESDLHTLMQAARADAEPNVPADAWYNDAAPRGRFARTDDEERHFFAPGDQVPAPSRHQPNATLLPKQPVVTTNKMLPVLGMAVGGADGKYIFNGSIIDYVVCPPSLENVAGAYAVYIDGESMFPRFKAGETVWVHPGKPARRGDDVIVQIRPDDDDDGSPPWGYVKEYVGRHGNRLVLHQYNPPSEIEFDIDEVLTIHPIVLAGKY